MITTSRYASSSLRTYARALSSILHTRYIARGKKTIDELVWFSRKIGDGRIIILKDPQTLEFISLDEIMKWKWLGERVEIHDNEG